MQVGHDPRRPPVGLDVRRAVWSGEDASRLDAIVLSHGGWIEVIVAGEAAVALRWTAPTGQVVCVSGPSGPQAIERLSAAIAGRPH